MDSPFFRFDGLGAFTLTVKVPPARICFSASSQAPAPESIAYLEAGYQLFVYIRKPNPKRRFGMCRYSLVQRESVDQCALFLAHFRVDLGSAFAQFLVQACVQGLEAVICNDVVGVMGVRCGCREGYFRGRQ